MQIKPTICKNTVPRDNIEGVFSRYSMAPEVGDDWNTEMLGLMYMLWNWQLFRRSVAVSGFLSARASIAVQISLFYHAIIPIPPWNDWHCQF